MWKMYFDEVKEEDIRFTEAWKEDANSIITFTGLLSAIVGAFIIEFYKKLSSDSGGQTVALLQQISHQLPNSPNNANPITANQPSSPGTAMIWVNALWLISLVLSLTCALIATLLQQWSRKYTQSPQSTSVLRHRARVHSLLALGMRKYKIPVIIETLPTLLHLSVYFFLGGLMIAFHTINKTVAIAVDVAAGVSGLAYIALNILPCLDVKCPYRTLISEILWYPCHALLSFGALCFHRCLRGLGRLLKRPVLPRGQRVLLRWLWSRGFSVSNHWRFLTYGLEMSIILRAVETLRHEDRGMVSWLFSRLVLGDKDKFLKFAASIPRYKIPDLIQPTYSVSLGESLLFHLRSCVASRYAALPDENVHERSLLVCLHAIRHIVKGEARPTTDLDSMRTHFANTSLMRSLWRDTDDFIRITSRSICALVARQVVRKQRLEGVDLSWLQEVTGESSISILQADLTKLDQMNFKSFVIGALPNHVPHRDLSAEGATSFNETLAILLGVRTDGYHDFATPYWETRLSEEVGRIQQDDRESGLEIFHRLRSVFPYLPLPVTSAPPFPVPPPPSEFPPPRAPPSPPPLAVYPAPAVRPSHRALLRHASI
ncbi:hypothetical protein V8E52_004660 [Russula decolorans]